jgi:hypothetical protein
MTATDRDTITTMYIDHDPTNRIVRLLKDLKIPCKQDHPNYTVPDGSLQILYLQYHQRMPRPLKAFQYRHLQRPKSQHHQQK